MFIAGAKKAGRAAYSSSAYGKGGPKNRKGLSFINAKAHKNARKLRKEMPPTEQRLWFFIRRKQLAGLRFRRQHTIGPYIVDFACVKIKLVIELDGGQHSTDNVISYDTNRNKFMERNGWTVLRFWNNEVYDNLDGVLEAVLDTARNLELTKNSP